MCRLSEGISSFVSYTKVVILWIRRRGACVSWVKRGKRFYKNKETLLKNKETLLNNKETLLNNKETLLNK